MSLQSFLDRILTYERDSAGQDAAGGKAPVTVATLASGIPACVAPAKDSIVVMFHRRNITVDYTILTTADLNTLITGGVQPNDRLNDGGTLYVIEGVQRMSNPLIYPGPIYRVHCRLLNPAR